MTIFQLKKFFLKRLMPVVAVCMLWASLSIASQEYWPTQGWRRSSPEMQGMKSGMLADMMEFIIKEKYEIDSISIIRNGYLVTDAYFFPFRTGLKHIIHSCTKSITSALVGIAIDQGYIKGIEEPVSGFFPERSVSDPDGLKNAMTLEHLLIMAPGLTCRDSYLYGWQGLIDMKRSRDWIQYILDLPMAEPPGRRFEYCNGASYLLSAIIQKSANMELLKFARDYLFGPLGIKDVRWQISPQGIYIGWGEMWLTPHDMAKIGWLYLNNGLWNDRQVLSERWVKASTSGHISGTLFDRYGYQWWVDSAGFYMAVGYKGQFIFVVPEKNMVVVFTGDLPVDHFYVPRTLLTEHIIPAASSSKVLPTDRAEDVRLKAVIDRCSAAPEKGFIWKSEREGKAENGFFVRDSAPAFEFPYPAGSRKESLQSPDQVMAMRTLGDVAFQASVLDMPSGMKLNDIGPGMYVPRLENLGSQVMVTSNREITLKDGTKACRTDIEWLWQDTLKITSIVVCAEKDGKCVLLAVHPWQYPEEVVQIVEGLTFR